MRRLNKYICKPCGFLKPERLNTAHLNFLRAPLRYVLFITAVLFFTASTSIHAEIIGYDSLRRDSLIEVLNKYRLQKKEMRQYEIVPADTTIANLLWDINNADDYFKNPKEFESRIAELKEITYNLNYKKGIANAITGEGVVLHSKQEYQKAVEWHKKALALREQINDTWGIRWSYFNIGLGYASQNLNKEAAEYFLKSIKLAEQNKDSTLLNFAYVGIASIYQTTGNVTDAINFQAKAVEYLGKSNNKKDYCLQETLLAYYFILNNNLDKAKDVLKNVYTNAQELKNSQILSFYYEVLGELDVKQENYGNAILNFKLCNALEDSINIQQNTPYNYRNIAECILKADKRQLAIAGIAESKKYDEAIRYAQKSLELTIPSNIMDITCDNYLFMSTAYEAQGNSAQALKYFKMGRALKDSMYNAENTNTINGLKMQYENEKQEQQIALLQKDKALHQTEIQKQKTQRNILIAGCALVLLLIGFIANAYIAKTKANKEIEKTTAHLQNSQQQLVQQGKLAALGKMTADVALRIKEPIGKIKTLSPEGELLVKQYEAATTDAEKNSILQQLKTYLIEINSNGVTANDVVKDVLLQTRKQTVS